MFKMAPSLIRNPFRMLSILACWAFCSPVCAQNPTMIAIEINACVQKSGFYPDTFFKAKESFVKKSVKAFVSCLKNTSDPKAPEVLFALGVGYKFELTPHAGGYMENARAAFCAAAEQGYVLAQEECASFSSEDIKARHRWTLAAALNGSASAQADYSTSAWGNAIEEEDREYNHYLVSYLACHPAMLQPRCDSMPEDPELTKVCREAMKESATQQLANLAQCHTELNAASFVNANSPTRKNWEQRASKQLVETLKNIRQQVKRYPSLIRLQTITPQLGTD